MEAPHSLAREGREDQVEAPVELRDGTEITRRVMIGGVIAAALGTVLHHSGLDVAAQDKKAAPGKETSAATADAKSEAEKKKEREDKIAWLNNVIKDEDYWKRSLESPLVKITKDARRSRKAEVAAFWSKYKHAYPADMVTEPPLDASPDERKRVELMKSWTSEGKKLESGGLTYFVFRAKRADTKGTPQTDDDVVEELDGCVVATTENLPYTPANPFRIMLSGRFDNLEEAIDFVEKGFERHRLSMRTAEQSR